jgi:hypothetical protein
MKYVRSILLSSPRIHTYSPAPHAHNLPNYYITGSDELQHVLHITALTSTGRVRQYTSKPHKFYS